MGECSRRAKGVMSRKFLFSIGMWWCIICLALVPRGIPDTAKSVAVVGECAVIW